MRKKISLLLTGVMAIGLLAGCGSNTENNQGSTGQTAKNTAEESKETGMAFRKRLIDNLLTKGVEQDERC